MKGAHKSHSAKSRDAISVMWILFLLSCYRGCRNRIVVVSLLIVATVVDDIKSGMETGEVWRRVRFQFTMSRLGASYSKSSQWALIGYELKKNPRW